MRRLALCLSVSAALYALLLWRLVPAFETNDDAWMMAMASGIAYGEPTPHLIYTHASLGALLAALYTHAPSIPWYAIYLYTVHVVAWALILHGLLALRAGALAAAVFAAAFVFFGLELAMRLQFTSTAILLAAAALFHFLGSGSRASSHSGALLTGALLGGAGLIRMTALGVALLVFLPVVPFVARRIPWRRSARFAGAALAVLAVRLATDAAIGAADPRWPAYREFNAARALLEAQRLEEGALEEVGWSENDHRLFLHWFLADPAVYSTGALRTLLERVDHRSPTREIDLASVARKERLRIAAAAAIAALGLLAASWRGGLLVAGQWIWFLVVAAALLDRYERLPAHVVSPLLLMMALSPLAVTGLPAIRRAWSARALVVAAALALGVFQASGVLARQARVSGRNAQQAGAFLRAWHAIAAFDARAIYVYWPVSLQLERMSPFVSPASLPALRLVPLGWMVNSPPWRDQLEALGIEDVLSAVLERRDVHLLCFGRCRPVRIGWLEQYVREHRGRAVELERAHGDGRAWAGVWRLADRVQEAPR